MGYESVRTKAMAKKEMRRDEKGSRRILHGIETRHGSQNRLKCGEN